MHIEPGLVSEAKILLSYATAAAAGSYTLKLAYENAVERGVVSLAARAALATVAVFTFFELMPHAPVGVSEVHLILGSTLFLMLGLPRRRSAWPWDCCCRGFSLSRKTLRNTV